MTGTDIGDIFSLKFEVSLLKLQFNLYSNLSLDPLSHNKALG